MRFTLPASFALDPHGCCILDARGTVRARPAACHLHEGHRADLPEQLSGVPSARQHRADVAADLRGGAPVGPSRSSRRSSRGRCRRGSSTRTSASSTSANDRSLDRPRHRRRSRNGLTPERPRAIPPTCRRRASSRRTRRGRSASRIVDRHPCRTTYIVRREGARPVARHSRGSASDRRPLHQGRADHSDEGIHGHPSHPHVDRRADGCDARQRSSSMDTDGSLEVGEQGVFLNEYADRQAGRRVPGRLGPVDQGGNEDQLPDAPPCDRQGRHRRRT